MKILSVVGARPNFMKIAPIHKALLKHSYYIKHLICHTGQHYDQKMSKVFFDELDMPKPDFYLGVGSGSHAEQTAKIMIGFEKVLAEEKPDLVIVAGDVNSTIACALTAKKLNIKVAHIEAGLRSFDMEMPEEINRILTDRISDYLFVSEPSGIKNLKAEGVPDEKIIFAGNVMIDSLIEHLHIAEKSKILEKYGLIKDNGLTRVEPYILITMHRPSNVDNPESLSIFFEMLNRLSKKIKIIFPVHPRTLKKLELTAISNPKAANPITVNHAVEKRVLTTSNLSSFITLMLYFFLL
jgi:UDP-N-acetylglucosamine 2-epimerase (non-hydrolysing)